MRKKRKGGTCVIDSTRGHEKVLEKRKRSVNKGRTLDIATPLDRESVEPGACAKEAVKANVRDPAAAEVELFKGGTVLSHRLQH